jgi:hypothetical protein
MAASDRGCDPAAETSEEEPQKVGDLAGGSRDHRGVNRSLAEFKVRHVCALGVGAP